MVTRGTRRLLVAAGAAVGLLSPISPVMPTATAQDGPGKVTITSERINERSGHVVVVGVTVSSPQAVTGKVVLDTTVNGKRRSIGDTAFNTPVGGAARRVRVQLNGVGRKLSDDRKQFTARVTASGDGLATERKALTVKTLSGQAPDEERVNG